MTVRGLFAKSLWSLILVLCVLGAGEGRSNQADRDWVKLWGQVLSQHTQSVDAEVGTRVDYEALSKSALWPELIESFSRVNVERIAGRDEKLAFWINAYNIFAINIVLENYPVEGIKDIGSWIRPVWKRTAGQIGTREYSLDEIEHRILRPMGEPRIHGAIVCASISCPNLLREPYLSSKLTEQLDASLRAFFLRPEKGMAINRKNKTLRVSKVFDWFEEDFKSEGGVLPFVVRYAPPRDARWLRENRQELSIRYLPYDWALNQ